ncbi:MAG: hypothetical protein H0W15_04765 [Gemmatimonadales bacterium]|nr:hypothetical protein [Gemmatimonadales bacterium]
MTDSTSRLSAVCGLLNAAGAEYVVVGGFAVALHGVIRATKDVDVLIEPSAKNAARVLSGLQGLKWGIAAELDPVALASRPITIIGDDPRVDVLTIAWSVRYADVVHTMLRTEIDGVEVPYLDLESLIRSKQTGRLQDQADVEQLEIIARLRDGPSAM